MEYATIARSLDIEQTNVPKREEVMEDAAEDAEDQQTMDEEEPMAEDAEDADTKTRNVVTVAKLATLNGHAGNLKQMPI
jgi:hypothetical protein